MLKTNKQTNNKPGQGKSSFTLDLYLLITYFHEILS